MYEKEEKEQKYQISILNYAPCQSEAKETSFFTQHHEMTHERETAMHGKLLFFPSHVSL
jgi:hypothetical protein